LAPIAPTPSTGLITAAVQMPHSRNPASHGGTHLFDACSAVHMAGDAVQWASAFASQRRLPPRSIAGTDKRPGVGSALAAWTTECKCICRRRSIAQTGSRSAIWASAVVSPSCALCCSTHSTARQDDIRPSRISTVILVRSGAVTESRLAAVLQSRLLGVGATPSARRNRTLES
jgi:hypothetical protein